jgi:hypothetical protein
MNRIVIDADVVWPISIGMVLIVLIINVTSCSEKFNQLKHDETVLYLNKGCERTIVAGGPGTHWICTK